MQSWGPARFSQLFQPPALRGGWSETPERQKKPNPAKAGGAHAGSLLRRVYFVLQCEACWKWLPSVHICGVGEDRGRTQKYEQKTMRGFLVPRLNRTWKSVWKRLQYSQHFPIQVFARFREEQSCSPSCPQMCFSNIEFGVGHLGQTSFLVIKKKRHNCLLSQHSVVQGSVHAAYSKDVKIEACINAAIYLPGMFTVNLSRAPCYKRIIILIFLGWEKLIFICWKCSFS